MELKLSDIVERVELNPNSLAHILSQDVLPGMPEAGSQGVHRLFTVDQAYRLALCGLLVSAGLSLKNAVTVTRQCTKWLKGIGLNSSDPIVLTIIDRDIFDIESGDEHIAPDFGHYCLSQGCTVQSYPYPLIEQHINLTYLHELIEGC